MGRASIVAVVVALGLSPSALAVGKTRWAFPAIPEVRHMDSESSVCMPLPNNVPGQEYFGFDMSFYGTASNNVEVALGADMDGDGGLSFSETDVVVGWDCGRYFCHRPKTGSRWESPTKYADSKDRTVTYHYSRDSLSGNMATFYIWSGERYDDFLIPEPDKFVSPGETERHRIRWETTMRYSRYYDRGSYSHVRDVRLSGDLVPVPPQSLDYDARMVARLFGVSSAYVAYRSGDVFRLSLDDQEVVVSESAFRPSELSSSICGVYLDVVGTGNVEFTGVLGAADNWEPDIDTRVYVDDVLVASYSNGTKKYHVTVGSSGSRSWGWDPGWNMLRVTRRGRFRDSSPSGGFTIGQRGGIIQIH